jgi:hypothetical protein
LRSLRNNLFCYSCGQVFLPTRISDIKGGQKGVAHMWTPRLLQDKFSQLMPTTEIMIAAIYPVS